MEGSDLGIIWDIIQAFDLGDWWNDEKPQDNRSLGWNLNPALLEPRQEPRSLLRRCRNYFSRQLLISASATEKETHLLPLLSKARVTTPGVGILCCLRVFGWRWFIRPSNESYRTFLIRVSPHQNRIVVSSKKKERNGEEERKAYLE